MSKRLLRLRAGVSVGIVLLLVVACAGPQGPAGQAGPAGPAGPAASGGASAADVEKVVNDRFNTVDTKLALWSVQAGTAPRMLELSGSMNLMWFAAQAGNWEFAGFEVYRAGEQVKAIKVVRPARTELLVKYADPNLKALADAVKAKNSVAFGTAYDKTIADCNTCHGESEGGGFQMKAIKITRPTAPLYPNIDFKGP